MKKMIQQVLVLFLSVMMVLNVTGIVTEAEETAGDKDVYVYTEEDNALLEGDVFAKIEEAKAQAAAVCGGTGRLSEADYAAMVPAVIEAIESSETYVPGSLQANGSFLVWETTTGIPCCYDPRMETKLHSVDDDPLMETAAAETTLKEHAGIRGGLPGSANIGLIQPYWESDDEYSDENFRGYSIVHKNMWESLCAVTGGQGIRYSMKNATIDNVAGTLEQCGLVIFDSHGSTDYYTVTGGVEDHTSRANCSYLSLTTGEGITSQDTEPQTGTFGTYYHCMKGNGYWDVSGTCIASHMKNEAPHSLLYMGICLGMGTDGLHKPLREKGVEVCYGYSQNVTFTGETIYVQAILDHVKEGYTFGEAVMKAKQEHRNWDPGWNIESEDTARRFHIAFPVVVSSEDPYPGQGNVDTVQQVYSTWALCCNYTITAAANDSSLGSVSLDGVAVKAIPNEGCYISGYEILAGSAEVTRRGNDFLVRPKTDCTIQINFAKKVPAVITYMANGSISQEVSCLTDDVITLPLAADAPAGWTFAGWAEEEIEKTTARPAFLAPGASYEVTGDAVLYAVYTMMEDYREDVYELLTDNPEEYPGRYVITCGKTTDMHVLKGIAGGRSYETAANGGQAAFMDTGITLSGNKLYDVPDDYLFDWAYHEGYLSMRSVSTGSYVDGSTKTLKAVRLINFNNGKWAPGFGPDKAELVCKTSDNDLYMAFENTFCISETDVSEMQVWKQTPQGTDWYTTWVPEQEKPSFTGISVGLSGRIGMNFYVTIPEQYQESAAMVFRVGDTEHDAIPASAVSHEGTLYHFTCGVSSVEMAETITAVLSYEDDGYSEEVRQETSVENYLHTIVDNSDTVSDYRKAEKLAMALNNYGYYAQQSLPAGPNHVKMAGLYDALALPAGIEGFDVTITDNEAVTQRSFSLSLDSTTALNFYLSPYDQVSKQDIAVKDKAGNAVTGITAEKAGSSYRLSIPDISAHKLGDVYTVQINGSDTISASALSYVQKAQTDDSLSQVEKDTAMALYGYYLQAIAYAK